MKAKDRYRRITAYARATHRVAEWFRANGGWRFSWALPSILYAAQEHAYERLPENLRRSLLP